MIIHKSIQLIDQKRLWSLKPEEFNKFREEYDIPILLKLFLDRLPNFRQWMDEFNITDKIFHSLVPTGDWFKGNCRKYVLSEEYSEKISFLKVVNEKNENIIINFEPYLMWALKTLGTARFFSQDGVNPGKIDSPIFTGNPHEIGKEKLSRAILLSELEVLKIGNITLGEMSNIEQRNLDFVDLDHLTIEGKYHGTYVVNINFSSCNKINIIDADINFIKFFRCNLGKFSAKNSMLYDIEFNDCYCGDDITFFDSKLIKFNFNNSFFKPIFSNCELIDISYCPPLKEPYDKRASVYRAFRVAYQQRGQFQEASENYYKERVNQRSALNFYDNYNLFPRREKIYKSFDYEEIRDKGELDGKTIINIKFEYWKYIILIWIDPKTFFHALKFKFKWLLLLTQEFIWGYGERPLRILRFSAIILAVFMCIYHINSDSFISEECKIYSYFGLYNTHYFFKPFSYCIPLENIKSWCDALYLSLVTFSTLGYGDIAPKTSGMKIVCGVEALFGAFTIGLIVAGFSNKSRY